jgi:hypothetical protein
MCQIATQEMVDCHWCTNVECRFKQQLRKHDHGDQAGKDGAK